MAKYGSNNFAIHAADTANAAMPPSGIHLVVDIPLHGYIETVQGLIVPKGALHCQLGVHVILQQMATMKC